MIKKSSISKFIIATILFSFASVGVAESNPVHDPDLILFQAELEQRKINYDRARTLGKAGAVSQVYVDQQEAKYKLFAVQVVHYQRLTGNSQKDYARLLKIQNAESCPEFRNLDPSDKPDTSKEPSVLPTPSTNPGDI